MKKILTEDIRVMAGLKKIILNLLVDKADAEVENQLINVVNRIDVQMKKLSANGKPHAHAKL